MPLLSMGKRGAEAKLARLQRPGSSRAMWSARGGGPSGRRGSRTPPSGGGSPQPSRSSSTRRHGRSRTRHPHAVRGAAEEQSSPGDGQSAVYVYRRVAVDAKNAAQEQRGYRGQRAGDGEHNPAEHPPEYARAEPSRQAGAGETLAMSRSDVERVETRRPARFRTAPVAWEGAAAYDALGAAARASRR